MPEPLTTYVAAWLADYNLVGSDLWMLGNALKSAGIFLSAHNYNFAGLYLDAAGDAAHDVSRGFSVDASSMYYSAKSTLEYIDANIGGGGAVDMDAILAAMWDTDKLRSFTFINYIDAMRASIWNVEIYESHLTEWYIHFTE